jgi:T-complex protein 1 subunit theta
VIPRVLAENSGVKPKEVISKLYAAHSEGNKNVGFDIEGESGDVKVRHHIILFNLIMYNF